MVRATFSYASGPSTHFDLDYYVDRHVPLVYTNAELDILVSEIVL